MVQSKQRGATFHVFFLLFPTEQLCQLRSVAWIELCNTQTTLNKEKINCHNKLALEQWRRMWSQDYSLPLHRKHLFANVHPPLFKMSIVRIPFHVASQTKKFTFVKAYYGHWMIIYVCSYPFIIILSKKFHRRRFDSFATTSKDLLIFFLPYCKKHAQGSDPSSLFTPFLQRTQANQRNFLLHNGTSPKLFQTKNKPTATKFWASGFRAMKDITINQLFITLTLITSVWWYPSFLLGWSNIKILLQTTSHVKKLIFIRILGFQTMFARTNN